MTPFSININGKLVFFERPAVMAILNVTTDSFHEPSRAFTQREIEDRAAVAIEEGADIIDIGAFSTRPGCKFISQEEEILRLDRAISTIRKNHPEFLISVDTFRAEVARIAVKELGANIINDVSGGNFDDNMFTTVAELETPYILSHCRGNIESFHQPTTYKNVVADVMKELSDKVRRLCLAGAKDIIIDPGIGFSKSLEQNYQLLKNLRCLKVFERPILIGVSRKSLLHKLLDTSPEDTLQATSALNALCLEQGAAILRVHDVKAAKQCVKIFETLQSPTTHKE